jgi:5S rRNA maturation endonuclease (ribonuclease M5)
MRQDAVRQFLLELGVDSDDIEDTGRGWLNALCPLAPYKHAGGVDKRPSFGVSISDEQRSVYYCFGCSPEPKRLDTLLHAVWLNSGSYPYEAARLYMEHENHWAGRPSTEVPDAWRNYRERVEDSPLPGWILKKYPVLQHSKGYEARRVKEYLRDERGISEWVMHACRIRHNPHNQSIIFPLTDRDGRTFVLRERRRKAKEMWTVSPRLAGCPEVPFPKLKNCGVWFGMAMADDSRPLMLVEGEIDAMRLKTLGFANVVASATSSVSDAQIDALLADTLILGYDADKGGEFAHRRIRDRVRGKALLYEADWSVVDANDPGDLKNKEQLVAVLQAIARL